MENNTTTITYREQQEKEAPGKRPSASMTSWSVGFGRPSRRRVCLLCALIMLGAGSGCLTSPEIELTRHYTLNPAVETASATPVDLTLGIRALFSARVYSLPMAYLDDNHRIGYRQKDEWAEPPASMVTRALTDALAGSGRFKDVGNAADMARPDLLLTGELRKFHENRTTTPPTAEIELRLEVRPSRDPGVLYVQTVHEAVPLQSDEAGAFAEAMNEAVMNITLRLATAIAAVNPTEQEMEEAGEFP